MRINPPASWGRLTAGKLTLPLSAACGRWRKQPPAARLVTKEDDGKRAGGCRQLRPYAAAIDAGAMQARDSQMRHIAQAKPLGDQLAQRGVALGHGVLRCHAARACGCAVRHSVESASSISLISVRAARTGLFRHASTCALRHSPNRHHEQKCSQLLVSSR